MHIIIGLLTAVVTILVLLKQLADNGIYLGGLNPFAGKRARKWREQLQADPIFQIQDPMDVTALLMTAVAKADGDISAEQKRGLLTMFSEKFHLSEKEAVELLNASVFMLADGSRVHDDVNKILQPSLEKFTPSQAGSVCELLKKTVDFEGTMSERQRTIIDQVEAVLREKFDNKPQW